MTGADAATRRRLTLRRCGGWGGGSARGCAGPLHLFRAVVELLDVRDEREPFDAAPVHLHDAQRAAGHRDLIAGYGHAAEGTEHVAAHGLVQVLRQLEVEALGQPEPCDRASLGVASGMVGNLKFQSVKSSGNFSVPDNWRVTFSDIEGKPRTYNAHFACVKGARVLWLGETGFGRVE